MTQNTETASGFTLPFISRNSRPTHPAAAGGAAQVLSQWLALIFPEPGMRRMDYRVQTKLELIKPTRFMFQSGHWTGQGVQGYPWIWAETSNRRLHARVHGRAFWNGDHRAYLIDLGEELDQGTHLDLITQSLFVDEMGTFRKYLSHHARQQSESLTLTAAFVHPPLKVQYAHVSAGEYVESDWVDVTRTKRWGFDAYEKTVEPCLNGHHTIRWN